MFVYGLYLKSQAKNIIKIHLFIYKFLQYFQKKYNRISINNYKNTKDKVKGNIRLLIKRGGLIAI